MTEKNANISAAELSSLAEIEGVRECFGLEEGQGGIDLDNVASIAVKRAHVPSSPGLGGDVFFLFDCVPENPLVVIKKSDGVFVLLNYSRENVEQFDPERLLTPEQI